MIWVQAMWRSEPLENWEVSNEGSVRSWWLAGGAGQLSNEPRILSGFTDRKGYLRYTHPKTHAAKTTCKGHTLVYESFHGEITKGLMIRHWDGDPSNNKLSNLLEGTCKENHSDRERHGNTPRGSRNGMAKLTEEQIRWALSAYRPEIKGRKLRAELSLPTQIEIAATLGVTQAMVGYAMTGRWWKELHQEYMATYR